MSQKSGAIDDTELVVLVSREDIFSDQGRGPLLLKRGTEIHPDMLAKLLHCGVDPNQFYVKSGADVQLAAAKQAIRTVRSAKLACKHVVVLDANQKSLKRTIDALCQTGFQLGKIHPVRMAQYLGWTLGKYRPDILVIDYRISSDVTALDVLHTHMEHCALLEQIIMTVPLGAVEEEQQDAFFSQVATMEIDVLFKPVLPAALEHLIITDEPPTPESAQEIS